MMPGRHPEPSASHRRAGCPDSIESCDATGPRRRDWLLAFAAALVLADAFDAVLYAACGRDATVLPGLPVSRVLLLTVFAAAAILLAGDRRGTLDHLRAAWPLWPVLALAFASAAWSEQPRTTLLWAVALLGTSAFGLALAVRFSPRSQSGLTTAVITSIALASVVTALLWPAFGISPRGELHGLYVHKNLLGKLMALGAASAGVAAASGWRRPLALAALLLFGGVIVFAQSRASLLVAVIVVAAALLLLAARRWRRHAAAILAGGAAVTILAVAFLVATKPGLSLVARSETFSDRTRIWRVVGAAALETPWLGHGYGAFWPSPAGQNALALIRIPINQAHNGALDLAAELGLAGLVLVLAPLAYFAVAALRHGLDAKVRACLWPGTYFVFLIASNTAESGLLRHKLFWALYVASASHVARQRAARAGTRGARAG